MSEAYISDDENIVVGFSACISPPRPKIDKKVLEFNKELNKKAIRKHDVVIIGHSLSEYGCPTGIYMDQEEIIIGGPDPIIRVTTDSIKFNNIDLNKEIQDLKQEIKELKEFNDILLAYFEAKDISL